DAGVTRHPAGASSATRPTIPLLAATSSTVTAREAPGAKRSTSEANCNETGGTIISRAGTSLGDDGVAGTGSPDSTIRSPSMSKMYSTGNAGGSSGRPMSVGSSTSDMPGLPGLRSQYGWLSGVVAGSVLLSSRTTA